MVQLAPRSIFIGKVLVLYVVILEYLYPTFIKESIFNKALCFFLAKSSAFVLSIFSFDVTLNKTLIGVDGITTLYVATPCSGLDFILLFSILIVSYPTTFDKKYPIFCIGSIAILGLNVCRLSSLSLIHRFYFSLFEVNHHFIFNIIVYGFILAFWLQWAKGIQMNSFEIRKTNIPKN